MPLDREALQIGGGGHKRFFVRLDEWTNGRFRCAVQEDVQARGGEVRLFVEHDDVVVELRELDDWFQHVLLRDASGGVLGLRDVGNLPQQVDALQVHVDRFPRDEQRRVCL